MKNYPTLKTTIPYLQLQPLQKKHLPFLVELLNSRDIQRILFRVPTKISEEKEAKSVTKMYDGERPKEITYILTIKKLFTEKFIGYVKIKLIDWSVKSCYLSVAILPSADYRGKGYAKAAYESFFEYLFSIGFMKIYGRTYEQNIPTIKLNKATGFDFIGRQSNFILYPNNTSADALFFEKINPQLKDKYQKPYATQMAELTKLLEPIATARFSGTVTRELLSTSVTNLSNSDYSLLPTPLQLFVGEIIDALSSEITVKRDDSIVDEDLSAKQVLRQLRAENSNEVGLSMLSYPITKEQHQQSDKLFASIKDLLDFDVTVSSSEIVNESLLFGAYTPDNWHYLEPLFLGLRIKNSAIKILAAVKATVSK